MLDWRQRGDADKKRLGEAVNALRRRKGLSWAELFDKAVDEFVGSDYERHVRAGRIGWHRAGQLFNWLAREDPEVAKGLAAQLEGDGSPIGADIWPRFLNQYRREDGIQVLVRDRSLAVVTLSSAARTSRVPIRLGDDFCFELDVPSPRAMVAFQVIAGQHHIVPIAAPLPASAPEPGRYRLPSADWLQENDQDGRHRFVFIAGDEAVLAHFVIQSTAPVEPAQLDALATNLAGSSVTPIVWQQDVMFTL